MDKLIRFWFPVIIYSVMIFVVSSIPKLHTPMAGWQFDKVIHLSEYMIFGFLLCRAVNASVKFDSLLKLSMVILLGSLMYGLSDEFHQMFVVGRSSSLLDVLADACGGFLGSLCYIKYFLVQEQPPN